VVFLFAVNRKEAMETLKHITLRELDDILHQLDLPGETRVSVTIEENEDAERTVKRIRAKRALQKLRGSGSGSLNKTLLKEREADKHR